SKKALIDNQTDTPFEMGLGRLVQLDKAPFVGRRRLVDEHRRGHARQIVGLEIDWPAVESLYDALGMPPQISSSASRVAVPVYKGRRQGWRAARRPAAT